MNTESNDQLSLFDPPPDPADSPDPAPAPDPHRRRGEYALPSGRKVENCRSCGRPIIWIRTKTGAALPLSVKTIRTDKEGVKWCLSHWVDCPQSKEWKK